MSVMNSPEVFLLSSGVDTVLSVKSAAVRAFVSVIIIGFPS